MPDKCPYPLVVHRFRVSETTGPLSAECIEPGCDGLPEEHSAQLPCRWSLQLAHGKVFNGESFPRCRCPECIHIRRSGDPLIPEQLTSLGEAG